MKYRVEFFGTIGAPRLGLISSTDFLATAESWLHQTAQLLDARYTGAAIIAGNDETVKEYRLDKVTMVKQL